MLDIKPFNIDGCSVVQFSVISCRVRKSGKLVDESDTKENFFTLSATFSFLTANVLAIPFLQKDLKSFETVLKMFSVHWIILSIFPLIYSNTRTK